MTWTYNADKAFIKKNEATKTVTPAQYGTFIGVFIPTILMLFGVIIFLRLGWIVGHVGLATSLIIITFATLISLITTLSISSISTNIKVGKGGVYYMLSRSLGIEAGFAVGFPLYLKQSLSIAFCVIGFAESLHDLFPGWSITCIGIGTLISLALLAYYSLDGAMKVQVTIFIILIASLISLFTGSGEGVQANALPGETFVPEMPRILSFWTVFAIFFPAMTGVESSVSLSGNLKNPSRSLFIGTISALLAAYAVYMCIPIFLVREVSLESLVSDPLIMQNIAKVSALIPLGIWGATISSALGGLLAAPRTLQALSEDGLVPKIFGKTFGKADEPRIATLATFIIALAGVYYGSVNIIAPMLTMICLICYGVLNFSAGIETLMANPSWRPRFQVHWSISIFGALLCLLTMLMIDPGTAIIALTFVTFIYLMAQRRQLNSSWDDIRYGIWMFFSRLAIYRLANAEGISKSWRPHFLVFTKKAEGPSNNVIRFSQAISQSKGFLTVASFLSDPFKDEAEKSQIIKSITRSLLEQNIQALTQIVYAEKVTTGMHHMIDHYGLGPLVPNTIVFGGINEDELLDFTNVILKAHQRLCNVVILSGNKAKMAISSESKGAIHIWWDSANKKNSHLMLVLSYMFQRDIGKKAKIYVKEVVANEERRQQELAKFHSISLNKRLPIESEVLVSGSPQKESFDLLKSYSKNADLIFLSLRLPRQEEPVEEYAAYLKSLRTLLDELPIALVLSSEASPLEDILK